MPGAIRRDVTDESPRRNLYFYHFRLYARRAQINKLKHFRHIATRYDRRAVYFLACLHLASAMIWMR
jgi:hypothetical protein